MLEMIAAVGAVLTALGVGGAIGAYIQHRLQARRELGEREHELKQRRYLCIIILMLAKLSPQVGIAKVQRIRPDRPDLHAVEDELDTELTNAVVFASDDVLAGLATFLTNPTHLAFADVASAMRRDLWGRGHRLAPELVEVLRAAAGPASAGQESPGASPNAGSRRGAADHLAG
jgi:hypothetical protein